MERVNTLRLSGHGKEKMPAPRVPVLAARSLDLFSSRRHGGLFVVGAT